MGSLTQGRLVIARPFGQRAQAIVSYRDQHIIVGADSINSTTGERTRPADLLLAALTTDATFICQQEAEHAAIPLYAMSASAGWTQVETGGFAAPTPTAGIPIPIVRGAALDPDATQPVTRVRPDASASRLDAGIRLLLSFSGPTHEQASHLIGVVRSQSSICRLLSSAAALEIVVEDL